MDIAECVDQFRNEVKLCGGKSRGCTLREEATKPVPPEGDPNSKVWILGRNPGGDEDALGRPFIGPGGECLNRMLSMGGLRRESFWITNLCKCRSTEDRPPYPGDVKCCFAWLELEYMMCKPKVVCLLGNQVVRSFFPNAPSVSKIHGEGHFKSPVDGLEHWQCVFFLMHHPGYVVRKGRVFEADIAQDWVKVGQFLKELEAQ